MKKHVFIQSFCYCILLLLCAARSAAQAPPPTPEILYYRFDGAGTRVPNLSLAPPAGTDTADIMGGLSEGGTGLCGGALIGTGASASTDYVNTHWAPNLGTNSWTISFWTSGFGSTALLWYIFGDINTNSFRCFTNGVAGANNWILRGAGLTDVLVIGAATAAPSMTTFVYDATANNVYAYLNGVLVNTVAQGLVTMTGTGPFKVCGYSSNSGNAPGSLMDEFRMYNRAISAAEVLSLYERYTYNTITVHACTSPYTSPSGNYSWTVAGTYNDTLTGANMYCGDSVLTINLDFPAPATPTISISSSPNDTMCGSQTVTFTANTTNGGPSPSYQWLKNGFPVGTNSPNYTDNSLVNGDIISCELTSNALCASPVNDTDTVHIVVNGPSSQLAGTAGNTESMTVSIGGPTDVNYYADCDLMATLTPSAPNNLSGNTTVNVTIDNAVNNYNGQPYLQRHYDIEPANNAATATASIKLYAYQSEFDAYNTAAATAGLPLLPTGAVDNGNVRVSQFHGVGTAPANYPGPELMITPAVSWDAVHNWWVMDFPVTGFSGFYIHTSYGHPLETGLSDISAVNEGASNRIDWKSASEQQGDVYILEHSSNGIIFSELAHINAKGRASAYSYHDNKPFAGMNYYRLRLSDAAGNSSYTKVVSANVKNSDNLNIVLYPNPVKDVLQLDYNGTADAWLELSDMAGKVLIKQALSHNIDMKGLARGTYMLHINVPATGEQVTRMVTKE